MKEIIECVQYTVHWIGPLRRKFFTVASLYIVSHEFQKYQMLRQTFMSTWETPLFHITSWTIGGYENVSIECFVLIVSLVYQFVCISIDGNYFTIHSTEIMVLLDKLWLRNNWIHEKNQLITHSVSVIEIQMFLRTRNLIRLKCWKLFVVEFSFDWLLILIIWRYNWNCSVA